MLDKNDRRYIIRRIITYIAIAMIMLLFNSCDVHAISGEYINYPSNPRSIDILSGNRSATYRPYNTSGNTYTPFINAGEGTLVFSYYTEQQSNPSIQINSVQIASHTTTDCDIGTSTLYYDNTTLTQIVTAVCPVDFTSGHGLYAIVFSRPTGVGNISIYIGEHATFVPKDTTNVTVNQQQVVDAVNNSNQTLITRMQQSNQAVIDSAHADAQQAHQDAQNIDNTLKDDTPPSQNEVSGNTSDWANNNANSGVINQLVLMPITLLQSFVNGINNSCQTYDFGELWGSHITLPCINLSTTLGSVWTIIDIIMSGIFIFIFGKKCVKIFNDFTNLKSGQIDSLYGGGE